MRLSVHIFLTVMFFLFLCTCAFSDDNILIIRRVNPISDKMILPHKPVHRGEITDEMTIQLCPDEYEPVSFVLTAKADIKSLQLSLTDLTSAKGFILSADKFDLRVVKCWYQSGSAWVDLDQLPDKPLLVPELLLHDDSLVKVNLQTHENYLRVLRPSSQEYILISNSKEEDSAARSIPGKNSIVNDSTSIQPVDIHAGTNKQFWLTVYAPQDAKPGRYSGSIVITGDNDIHKTLSLTVHILPVELLAPYYTPGVFYRNPTGENDEAAYAHYERQMINLREHGVTSPSFYPGGPEATKRFLEIRRDCGLADRELYTIDSAVTPVAGIQDFLSLAKSYGFTDVYFYGIDEAGGERLYNQIPAWRRTKDAGGKIWASASAGAGYDGTVFDTVGGILDVFNNQPPVSAAEAAKWHSVGHRVFAYANPHIGPENPEIYRRNYGLLLWKNNYDGMMVYAYSHAFGGIWNDFDSSLRDITMIYPTSDGVIDTIAWEGFREAIDDVRYVTTLEKAIETARNSSDDNVRKTVAEARRFLDSLEIRKIDLDKTRAEMIAYLLKLNE